jgi:resolvase-like protein
VAGQRIGYVQVSTLDQNERRQLDGQALDRVFTDKTSGRDTTRPELTELLRFARDGDTVVVHSMDRLARNLGDLRVLVQGLTRKGVRVEFVNESLVFTGEVSPVANLMLSMMGAFAEFERYPDQGGAEGRHRPGPAARRLQRAEKGHHTGTGGRAGRAGSESNPQIRPRQRLRHQPANGLPVPPQSPSQAVLNPPVYRGTRYAAARSALARRQQNQCPSVEALINARTPIRVTPPPGSSPAHWMSRRLWCWRPPIQLLCG